MLFGWFYYDWTILLVIPGLIISILAQINVNNTFETFSKVRTKKGITGAEAARRVLDANGLRGVDVMRISGHLTDHYDPRDNIIRLSESVYDSTSAAAVGVACHEAGHAVQHARGYFPLKIRSAVIPATKFGSSLAIPIFMIGLIFASDTLLVAGILLYSAVAFFQLVTLPVEFNASSRALEAIQRAGILDPSEHSGAKRVLNAAAMTYVAALLTSLLTLLRLVLLAGGGRNRRR